MDSLYRNFYRNFYLKTSGYIPSCPLNHNVLPGDYFQIRNGEMVILGNIFRDNIIDRDHTKLEYGAKLNPDYWVFNDGISKPYSGKSTGNGFIEGEYEFTKQVLAFANKGSFFFRATNPESVKIGNWNEIKQQLIIKLTQTIFSFRELYLVTECVTPSDWTLAISNSNKGEIELVAHIENSSMNDIFGHETSKTIQSIDIEYYHRETKKKPVFYKAKKLVVQEEKLHFFISDLIYHNENKNEWARGFFKYDFHYDKVYSSHIQKYMDASILERLQANELNPNTALLYFKWADANLDDIENLFITYGNSY